MKSLALVAGFLGVALAATPRAQAWETTTHVGLAEQAALAADLDGWLRSLGLSGGMFEALTVPPADAPTLFEALARHSPIDGYVPDTRGEQPALSWLLAGAAIADANPTWAANHFFDPSTGAGWQAPRRGPAGHVDDLARGIAAPPAGGVPAPDWAASAANPLGLTGFLDQYEKAIRGATPGERGRALAGALIAAGAVMHTLGDLSSPTHARGDSAAHLAPMSDVPGDGGARFERLVAIGWGRLGVPAAAMVATRPTFRDFFTAPGVDLNSAGLADWTAAHFFSEGTLPRSLDSVGRGSREAQKRALTRSLRRPMPSLPSQLGLVAATQRDGTTLRDGRGTCLARYRVERGRLSWYLDDDCQLEQAAVILPVAAGYEAAMLRWLSRGQLGISADKQRTVAVTARGLVLRAGTVTLLAEDGRGLRTVVASAPVTSALDGEALASAVFPAEARRAIALYRGLDGNGEPVVSVGFVDL